MQPQKERKLETKLSAKFYLHPYFIFDFSLMIRFLAFTSTNDFGAILPMSLSVAPPLLSLGAVAYTIMSLGVGVPFVSCATSLQPHSGRCSPLYAALEKHSKARSPFLIANVYLLISHSYSIDK